MSALSPPPSTPTSRLALSSPFVLQPPDRLPAVPSPQPLPGSGEGQQRLLTGGTRIRRDRDQRRHWTVMLRDDGWLASLRSLKQFRKLLAKILDPSASD